MTIDPTDPPPDTDVIPWRPEVTEAIYALLYRDDLGLDRLVAELDDLAQSEGAVVYSELLYLLSHIRFEEEEGELVDPAFPPTINSSATISPAFTRRTNSGASTVAPRSSVSKQYSNRGAGSSVIRTTIASGEKSNRNLP